VYALDAARGVIAKVDDTGTWEFRSDLLDQACELIGLLFERESFERVEDLLSTHPNLAEPKLEFEAHHPAEEAVRELSIGVFYGGLLAAGLLSSGGMALAFVNPVGNFYKGLIALGCVVMCVLSWWSLSKRRMRRSMRGPPRCPSALVAVRHLSGAAVSNSPRLVLICGLPGAGKTTLARRREAEIPGTRLSPDEWMVALGVGLWDDEFRGRLETQLWSLAQELLAKGQSVVLDYGYWTRAERDEKRLLARSLGVKVELHYLKASIEELEQRLEKRNLSVEWRDFPITREHLETWSLTFEPPGPEALLLFDQ
jgi:predicted kinase